MEVKRYHRFSKKNRDPRFQDKDIGYARFIAQTGKDIPWHISRFHPNYKFTEAEPTPIETLKMAEEIGKKHGLKYIHFGNVLL